MMNTFKNKNLIHKKQTKNIFLIKKQLNYKNNPQRQSWTKFNPDKNESNNLIQIYYHYSIININCSLEYPNMIHNQNS